MWPPRPASIIGGTKHSSTLIGPTRLTSIICCQSLCSKLVDRPPGGDAGDVHHHVHAAVGGVDLRGQRDDGVVVADVDRLGVADRAAGARDLGGGAPRSPSASMSVR